MPLNGYGLLIGKVTGSRPQRKGNPHWLLFVQPADAHHPPYRVAVNLQSTEKGESPEIQYQVVDLAANSALIRKLAKIGATPSFLPAGTDQTVPCLDFVRGGFLDPSDFEDVPSGANPFRY